MQLLNVGEAPVLSSAFLPRLNIIGCCDSLSLTTVPNPTGHSDANANAPGQWGKQLKQIQINER